MIDHPILAAADLWHTGIVVDDLEAAKAELGLELGVNWRDGGAAVRLSTDDGTMTVQTAYALSLEGPHHVELVQSIPGTVWTSIAPGHAHHLGYWVDDIVAISAALIARGAVRLASVAMTDDAPPMCAYLRATTGLHVEIVDRRLRKVLLPGS
jgi:hypothetical protein